MISKTHPGYWKCFNALPLGVQNQAKERFNVWKQDAFNSSLQFKHLFDNVWSVRINQQYRGMGLRHGNMIVWFWIGTHAEYDQLLKRV